MKQRLLSLTLALFWLLSSSQPVFSQDILDAASVPKYQSPMIIPPAMPRAGILREGKKKVEYYDIALRQFDQQILPPAYPPTTVWSYGAVNSPGTVAEGGSFNYPAFTIETRWRKPVRIHWRNELVDEDGHYLPHLLPVDQTLHWANPVGPVPDTHGTSQASYTGPVPMIVHVHGMETDETSDGFPEAWFMPAASDLGGFSLTGTLFPEFRDKSPLGSNWTDPTGTWTGAVEFQYPNDQRATTLWYHDHTLGMTRQNVYAGPAGFYLIRGGPDDMENDGLPSPAPRRRDRPGRSYREIPIVIQDRMFHTDGSLFYPDNRAFFEGLAPADLQIPFAGDPNTPSDVAPIWNPEFFGDVMVTNGVSWPYLDVHHSRYRFRFLNGCNSRFLILRFDTPLSFWQIGSEGGFLPQPVELTELLIAPAERADVVVDFSSVPEGSVVRLLNLAPDEPFGGGVAGVDFDPADPGTTGQVMEFRVRTCSTSDDPDCDLDDDSVPPTELTMPTLTRLPAVPDVVRQLSLNELESELVQVVEEPSGKVVAVSSGGSPFGPTSALLGTLNPDGSGKPMLWTDPGGITETPTLGATEVWEIHNFTADAHPIHIHLVQFEVVDREIRTADSPNYSPGSADIGTVRGPEVWETGYKDTVISYPGEVTRVKARFDLAGLYVWHCHILEHEDNEMMRPFRVVDPGQ